MGNKCSCVSSSHIPKIKTCWEFTLVIFKGLLIVPALGQLQKEQMLTSLWQLNSGQPMGVSGQLLWVYNCSRHKALQAEINILFIALKCCHFFHYHHTFMISCQSLNPARKLESQHQDLSDDWCSSFYRNHINTAWCELCILISLYLAVAWGQSQVRTWSGQPLCGDILQHTGAVLCPSSPTLSLSSMPFFPAAVV